MTLAGVFFLIVRTFFNIKIHQGKLNVTSEYKNQSAYLHDDAETTENSAFEHTLPPLITLNYFLIYR